MGYIGIITNSRRGDDEITELITGETQRNQSPWQYYDIQGINCLRDFSKRTRIIEGIINVGTVVFFPTECVEDLRRLRSERVAFVRIDWGSTGGTS